MAERELSKKLGEVEVDGLVTAIDPHIVIGAGVIRKAASGTLKLVRGTVLAKSSGTAGDSKLVVQHRRRERNADRQLHPVR